jgi:type 1 glutamine amidotransferase
MFFAGLVPAFGADEWVTYPGGEGIGNGKHVVFISGDDEYRSEESMPQMAKILSQRHGFKCTMLWALNKETGAIDPATLDHIPGLEVLDGADLVILFLRFRELPDDQMKRIMDYTNSGRPIVAIRTSTHPFHYTKNKDSTYAKWTWTSRDPKGGYGREVLGETWVNHYGHHKVESTRGIPAPGQENNPILNGCEDIWGPSDVYGITTLTGDSEPVVLGQVLTGMKPGDSEKKGMKRMPIAWTKSYRGSKGVAARIFTTTLGHSFDFKSEGVRRLVVNGTLWAIGMGNQIPERANVELVGEYTPSDIGFGTHKVGVMPEEHALK